MNAATVSGIKLKVSISRNQPIECGDKGVTAWNAIGRNLIIIYHEIVCSKYSIQNSVQLTVIFEVLYVHYTLLIDFSFL